MEPLQDSYVICAQPVVYHVREQSVEITTRCQILFIRPWSLSSVHVITTAKVPLIGAVVLSAPICSSFYLISDQFNYQMICVGERPLICNTEVSAEV